MTRSFLIDSDAFHAARTLGLLPPVCAGLGTARPLLMTEIPAHQELVQIRAVIDALKTSGHLIVHPVAAQSDAGRRYRDLRKAGVDKGEAEAIAWAVETYKRDARPYFVSVDGQARKKAAEHGIISLDMMGAIVEWVEDGVIPRDVAKKLTVTWDDRSQQCGRPKDYKDFNTTYAHRLSVRIV